MVKKQFSYNHPIETSFLALVVAVVSFILTSSSVYVHLYFN